MSKYPYKVAFFSPDLEQVVHRGIAIYTKMLLKCTNNIGYKNYLITGAKCTKDYPLAQQIIIEKHLENPSSYHSTSNLMAYWLKNQLSLSPLVKIERERTTETSDRLKFLYNLKGFLNQKLIYQLAQNVQPRLLENPYKLNINHKFNLIFCTSPSNIRVPHPIKLVQTLHDIIPITRNDHPDNTFIFYRRVQNMLRHSDLILSVSETSRRDILSLFPEYEQKIITVYEPLTDLPLLALKQIDESLVLKKYHIQRQKYLLFVSSLEKRKNVFRLIEAYLTIQEQVGLPLIIIGEKDVGNPEILPLLNSLNSENKIRYLGYISHVEKFILLKNALAFIFPSLYEGFGLPPLEAMQVGCPVLTSQAGSLSEVCADAALYIEEPQSTLSIAQGILKIVKNQPLRQELSMKGYIRASEFSFGKYQQRLSKILENLLDRY
ncbi:glycosyltransferase family 4 protein [Nostoc sp. LEGE 06077]|uniref:glycosyltransferase family 4 protein n=1 Tax=Nostoc sp. LEGE 06077 TaxID=915325 RepID=UPI00188016CC|nr:glycosyltransferase family 1 protein [Nostoc sp. LEGE 06077]MBE9210925.1 glycosyltransferase family 4 protein [Nostoc sp. LEGE 06077]